LALIPGGSAIASTFLQHWALTSLFEGMSNPASPIVISSDSEYEVLPEVGQVFGFTPTKRLLSEADPGVG
jgi:hypothetical protein